jgi:hypothetical protein
MTNKQTTTPCEHCAELEQRNEWLENQLATWDPVYAIRRALPSESEAAAFLKIVTSRFPHMKEQNTSEPNQVQNFLASLAFIWSLTVTREAVTKFSGGWWIGEAQSWCASSRISGRPRTLLPAIICSDVPYMLSNDQIFLDPHRSKGTAVDRASWKRILLAGGDLRAAIPVKPPIDGSIGFRKVLATTW